MRNRAGKLFLSHGEAKTLFNLCKQDEAPKDQLVNVATKSRDEDDDERTFPSTSTHPIVIIFKFRPTINKLNLVASDFARDIDLLARQTIERATSDCTTHLRIKAGTVS